MVDPRITKARSRLVIEHPFFGCLAMNLIIRASNAFDTMATDAKHLFYRPAFLDEPGTTIDLLMFILAHEVLHCALGHCSRRGNREHMRWNTACDHVVNLMLVAAGFQVPDNRYCDPRFSGLSAEKVYDLLEQEEQKQQEPPPPPQPEQEPEAGAAGDDDPQDDDESGPEPGDTAGDDPDADEGEPDEGSQGDGDPKPGDGTEDQDGQGNGEAGQGDVDQEGDGSGEDGAGEPEPVSHGDPGRCGEVLDAAPADDQAALDDSAQEWEVATRQAVNIARKQDEGRLPGFIEEVIDHLEDPRTDWRDALHRFADPYSSTKDYSWVNPSRRMLSQGFIVPGMISDGIHHVAIIVDSSGSVDERLLSVFGGEAQAALDNGAIDKLTVIFADTDVRRVAEYGPGDQIDFTVVGRGGTRFDTSFAWLNQNAPDIACAIYLSDLECSMFGEEPSYPVLWAGYCDDPQRLKMLLDRVPFGEAVEVTAF